ncbi:hypothetical protein [Mariniplasma anaerobium]|uniref:DUF3592 domain-containing protein n=1 Tax=Mariniplasma anaerobium TaxID=2735436 RepID=A0A7U9TIJ6_9MOLU|nr:hypothetical protein [Mariniplasma anaerobium]BCR36507.1 hypothetical protein MPAN_014000 [Mariniplasma anaerobium]
MHTFSMKKAFKNNGNLMSLFFAMIVSALVIIGVLIFDSEMMWFVYLMAALIVVEVILVLFLIMSFKSFNKVDLETTKATVSLIWYMRSRKMIVFTYNVNGIEYKKTNSLWAWKYVRTIRKGDEIEICYKKDYPNKALIKDMYFME